MKADDLKNKPPNILLYGPAGTGKTALVSQASNGYMMDFDDGMLTARNMEDEFSNLRKNIEFDTFLDTNPEKPKAWLEAKKKVQSIVELVQAGKWEYDAFVVDSLTGMAKCASLHVMNGAGDPFKQPQIQHWGMMVREIESMLTRLRAMKVLKLTTAHELAIEHGGADCFTPKSITKPHSIDTLMWLFDEVWHTELRRAAQGKINFIVTGKPSSSYRCRTRSSLSVDVVHNEIGLAGLLEKIGFKYNTKEKKDGSKHQRRKIRFTFHQHR